jgi:RND family efflux transporter MFP subunit
MHRETRIGRMGAVAMLAAAVVVGASLASCSGKNSAASDAGSETAASLLGERDVATVVRTDLVAGVPVSGNLKPDVDIQIAAPAPELLDAVLVREGQAVTRGQVLARFRTSALAPAAASAVAHLKSARADHERMQNLFKEGAVSQRDLEAAEAAYRAAESAAAYAGKQLDEATVRAPVSGVIAARMVQAGDRVKEGATLFQLVNTSQFEFEATVPSEYVAQIRVGAPVALSVPGFPEGSVSGRVARVNAEADPATRQVRIYVQVPNPGSRLVGGLFASGRVVTGQEKAMLAVPRAGVRTDAAGRRFVWILVNGKVARRDVEVGLVDEGRDLIGIKSGLSGGETAVVGPVEGLVPGQSIRVQGKGV